MHTTNGTSNQSIDAETEAERRAEILREIRPKGFYLEPGHQPCLCGAEHIKTRRKRGYSDSLIFYHRCEACGNSFSTYIEG
jgi:hypothetical protein